MSRYGTNIYVDYEDFEYKGKMKYYSYEVPFDVVCDGIRYYFDNQGVNLDGTNRCIWNAIVGLSAIDELEDTDDVIKYCMDACRDIAYEEFVEGCKEDEEVEEDE